MKKNPFKRVRAIASVRHEDLRRFASHSDTLLNDYGLTLIELIIASMLVVVVLFGLFAISNVLNVNGLDYGQRFGLASETQATLNHILNNAALAVGSNTNVGGVLGPPDNGIVLNALGPPSICIHQRPSGNDSWLCYFLTPGRLINYCTKDYNPFAGNRGADGFCRTNTIQYLGTAFAWNRGFLSGVLTISIQNCWDNTPGSTCRLDCRMPGAVPPGCDDRGTIDPVGNPSVVKSGSVATLQNGT